MARSRADLQAHPQVADLFGAALGRCENGIIILDHNERVVFWNNWIADSSGIPSQVAAGRSLAELFPEARLRRLERAVTLALTARQASVLSRALNPRILPLHQLVGSDAEAIEHQAIVKPLDAREGQFCLIQVYDVTDAVHRERFLRSQASDMTRLAQGLAEGEARLRSMLEASPIGVAVLNKSGVIRFANSRLAQLFLAPASKLVGAHATDFFTRPRNLLARLGEATHEAEVQFRRRDGSRLWAQVTAEPTEFEQAPAIMVWLYDISERKAAESALVSERDRATELARARTEFLAMVSHEIRTPLNGIMGTVGMLAETTLDEGQREYVEMIRFSGDALLAILNDVLDLSKFESGKISLHKNDVDVVRLVEKLVTLMSSRAAEKDLDLTVSVGDGVQRAVVTDAGRLRQVLLNLIGNAIKFTERGGVEVRIDQLDATDTTVRMRFSVCDTGIGIAEEHRSQLFTEFYQIDPAGSRHHGGTGLGLAICKRIVEAMGGRIGVESKPGAGSSFWFALPLAKGDERRIADGRTGHTRHHPPVPRRILLVEDNEINQKVAMSLLARNGHDVTVVATAQAALSLLGSERFDLVLMDVQLPGMDGIEATRRIRAMKDPALAATPVVALTANAMPGDDRRCLEAGMDHVLTKPINPDKLELTIEAATRRGLRREVSAAPEQATTSFDARIDEAMLDNLRTAIGSEKVDELIELFRDSGKQTIDEIVATAAAGEIDRTSALAHRLKGGALNLGLGAVSDAAIELERAIQDGCDIAAIEELINKLAGAYGETIRYFAS